MVRFKNILILICVPALMYTQEFQTFDSLGDSSNISLNLILEPSGDGEENLSAIDDINELNENPVDMNAATMEELCRIPHLSSVTACTIIQRRTTKKFASLEDVLTVEGVSSEMLPFMYVTSMSNGSESTAAYSGMFRSRVSKALESKRGFIEGQYRGSPMKLLNKLRWKVGSDSYPLTQMFSMVDGGIVTEKDPGERQISDFAGYYSRIKISTIPVTVLFGNYEVRSSEGLVLWGSSANGRGADIMHSIRKNGSGIYPHISTNENSGMQGIAFSLQTSSTQVDLFYSNKQINASIDSVGVINAIDQAGLFRTENEIRKRNSARELLFGYRVKYKVFHDIMIGGTAYLAKFTRPMILDGDDDSPISKFGMQGFNLSYTNANIDVFSEIAINMTKVSSFIYGISYVPMPVITLAAALRNYSNGFRSIHGNAYSESSEKNENEKGICVGVNLQPAEWLKIILSYDQYEHPDVSPKYSVSVQGNEFISLIQCHVLKRFRLLFRMKRKEMPERMKVKDWYGRDEERIIQRVQENYRLSGELHSSRYIQLRNTLEYIGVSHLGKGSNVEHGFLFSQTIKCRILRKVSVRARAAIFATGSFDTRIYEFEDDVPYASSFPPLYGRGIRWYCVVHYKIFSKMNISAKVSQTMKEGIYSIGSGLDEISGNTQSHLDVQFDFHF